MSFVVTGVAGGALGVEAFALDGGIVKLGKGVGDFPCVDEAFEPFDQARVVAVGFGQGGDVQRVVENVCGLCECGFDFFFEQGFDGLAPIGFGIDMDAFVFGGGDQGGGIIVCEGVDATGFDDRVDHGDAFPWAAEVDFSFTKGDFCGAVEGLDTILYNRFDECHHVGVVFIGVVAFDGGEFRVVFDRDTFIAEAAVDLVHIVREAACDEAF